MSLTIVACTEQAELFDQYRGRLAPQPVHIELDLRLGRLLAEVDPEVGSAVPRGVFDGFLRRYSIPVLTGEAANQLLDEIAPLAERILEDCWDTWDGSDHVAVLGADAQEAEGEIQELLAEDFSASEVVGIFNLDVSTNGDEEREYAITGDTSDARLGEIVDDITGELASVCDSRVAVCPGLATHLADIRAELAQDNQVIWSVMDGETQGPAVEPGPLGIAVPDEVLSWAESHGLSADNPSIYLLVTPEKEADLMDNEVAWMRDTLPTSELSAIRAELFT